MEDLSLKEETSRLVANIKSYLEDRYDLAKLNLIEKAAIISSSMITWLVVMLFVFSFMLFSSIALALYLSNVYQSTVIGFWTVGLGYFVLCVILIILRKPLILNPISRFLIRVLISDRNEVQPED
ncbi:MAG: hypothetical protein RIS47_923 [Bacteroidota bacterium]|jgi:hypothetical protein